MENYSIVEVLQQMFYFTLIGVAIIIVPSLIIGLIIAVFQAATQINEMTLSFLPKLVVTLVILAVLAPWMAHQIVEFMRNLVDDIPYIIG